MFPSLPPFLEIYAKHSALNLGQVLHGARYWYSHPDADALAARGSLRHLRLSARIRVPRLANDLLFTLLPPQWHHTPEELAGMRALPAGRWFLCGYAAWRFTEDGRLNPQPPADVDRRWDPRCREGLKGV